MSLHDDWCFDINFVFRNTGLSSRSVPWLLLNPSQYEIGCYARRFHLLFRAANGLWLSVSLKHTTFNTPPQWVGMMSDFGSVAVQRMVCRTSDGYTVYWYPLPFPQLYQPWSCQGLDCACGCVALSCACNAGSCCSVCWICAA